MPTDRSTEDILKAEEERYAQLRTGTLSPPREAELKISDDVRSSVRFAILRYFWLNPRDHRLPFDAAPEKFAPAIAKILRGALSKKTLASIDAFKRGEAGPFLILRNIMSVPIGFPNTEYRYREIAGDWDTPVSKHCQRQMRTIDCTLGGITCLLDASPARRFAQIPRCSYDLTTRWDVQEAPDAPRPDMPLRYHQSTVERPLPNPQPTSATTALYAAYGAIRNPRRIPIYLLPVDTIIEALKGAAASQEEFEATLRDLREPLYTKEYPRLSQHVYRIDGVKSGEPILTTYRGRDVMSYDSSLVWVSRHDQARGKDAIDRLRLAIERASWNSAYEIKLARHDVLIVDNMRAMVARSEETPAALDLLSLPPLRPIMRRWLREMHGFAHRGHSHAHAAKAGGRKLGGDSEYLS